MNVQFNVVLNGFIYRKHLHQIQYASLLYKDDHPLVILALKRYILYAVYVKNILIMHTCMYRLPMALEGIQGIYPRY